MFGSKNLFASKTIWGALIVLIGQALPIILPLIGVQPGELATITAGIGAVIAIYGRITAKKTIGAS